MAGGGGGGGDKRSSNAEINLVPYIDLLSTLICFLLITAVWQQVSVISTNVTPPSKSDAANPNPPPEDPNKVELSLKLYADYLEVVTGKEIQKLGYQAGQVDLNSLIPLLKNWRQQFPNKQDVTINSEARIPYKLLIQAMDALNEATFTDVAINTN